MRADVLAYAVTGHAGPFVPVADWPSGVWLNEPIWRADGHDVLMTAARGSDFWRQTAHGFTHDSGHAYLSPFEAGTAVEVDLAVNMTALLDQAGVLVRQSPSHWLTTGVAYVDDEPRLSTVHTAPLSDWSSHHLGRCCDERVTIRVSLRGQPHRAGYDRGRARGSSCGCFPLRAARCSWAGRT